MDGDVWSPSYPCRFITGYPLHGPQSRSGRCGIENNILALQETEPWPRASRPSPMYNVHAWMCVMQSSRSHKAWAATSTETCGARIPIGETLHQSQRSLRVYTGFEVVTVETATGMQRRVVRAISVEHTGACFSLMP
jgi:hypothetical protein